MFVHSRQAAFASCSTDSLDSHPMSVEPDPLLLQAATEALSKSTQRVVVLDHAGERYVAKRVTAPTRSLMQAVSTRWLVRRLIGYELPLRSVLLSDAQESMGFEARRILDLQRCGVRVPRLVHQDRQFLLLAHCGPTVEELLGAWTLDRARVELQGLARELAAFHRAGHWHGAAQIKNLTVRHGDTYRIDFEENFGERVPLVAAQAYDLVLLLNSISLTGPLTAGESRRLLPQLLEAYFQANPDAAVRSMLERALPWIRRIARLSRPFAGGAFRGRPRTGVVRLSILSDALSTYLGRP